MKLEGKQLYRALLARDARFDGLFFVGVTSTRIYCRPVCTAPKPREDRCRWFASAAAAERRGFRPCLRCRPELAPGVVHPASVDAVARLASVAGERIAAGALNESGVDQLAAELGVSGRHLRRAVERGLGASPVEIAQTQRLLLAKRLLTETALPVSRIALASGFRSVRRFNALFQERYRLNPTALRRAPRPRDGDEPRHDAASVSTMLELSLAYRTPFAWEPLIAYLAGRATPGVEAVVDGRYWRTLRVGDHHGVIRVRHDRRARALRVSLSSELLPVLVPTLGRVRRVFDLDAEPAVISRHLQEDDTLRPFVERHRGLRVPGTVEGFELALRAILGQQVSVRGATTLAGRLASQFGEAMPPGDLAPGVPASLTRFAPTAQRIAEAGIDRVASVGVPRTRAESIVVLARAVAGGDLGDLLPGAEVTEVTRRLMALPGIGEWTAEYIALRALRWPDAFPHGDLGLRKAMGGLTPAALRRASERWRPWRAYAALHLWTSLGS